MQLRRSETGRTLVVGHRGCEVGPEPNTLAALEEGARLGADLAEVDVQVSRDGVAFLRHHYSSPDGRWACETDFADLHDRPTRLAEALDWSRGGGLPLLLDLKAPFDGFEPLADAVLRDLRPDDPAVAIASDHTLLLALRARLPGLPTGAIVRARLPDLPAALAAARAQVACLSYDLARAEDVAAAHAAGAAVSLAGLFVPDFARAAALGVDLVSYGDPAAARRALAGI